jgi:cob(I)alamin adenosyltransferase
LKGGEVAADAAVSHFSAMKTEKRAGRGLIIVYTGDGKGKTTAALGLALRAVGRAKKVLMLQFIKGSWDYGELHSAKRLAPEFELVPMGEGFVGIIDDTKPFETHRLSAQETLTAAREKILSGIYDVVILDEVNYAVRGRLIELQPILDLLKDKPPHVHVVLTGRNARPELIEMADLVTEMKEIKHPYQKGILAQKGIDY